MSLRLRTEGRVRAEDSVYPPTAIAMEGWATHFHGMVFIANNPPGTMDARYLPSKSCSIFLS
ncbi:MAG TPA: hypothetical protein VF678_15655, partial [bacterium]